MKLKTLACTAMIALSLGLAPTASASLITGSSQVPVLDNGANPGTLLATMVSPFTSLTSLFSGVLTSAVYQNASGFLDFYYQISNSTSSLDSIDRLTITGWAGAIVDTFYRTDTFGPFGAPTAGINPDKASRSGVGGNSIGFFINNNGPIIDPGDTSAVLIVKSNATFYQTAIANVIDGDVAATPDLAPGAEPGALLLLGTVLVGVALITRRRIAQAGY